MPSRILVAVETTKYNLQASMELTVDSSTSYRYDAGCANAWHVVVTGDNMASIYYGHRASSNYKNAVRSTIFAIKSLTRSRLIAFN